MHMIGVRTGAVIGQPSLRRNGCRPNMAIPDDIHNAQTTYQSILMPVLIRGKKPGKGLVDLCDACRIQGGDCPVPRTPLFMLALSANITLSCNAIIAGPREGLEEHLAK